MIEDHEIPVFIRFEYQPYEAQTLYSPEVKASVEDITSCQYRGTEVPDWVLEPAIEQLKKNALEYMECIIESRKIIPRPRNRMIASQLQSYFS